jgi:TonB family protein
MNFSFGAPPRPKSQHQPSRPGQLADLSLGPAARGDLDVTPYGDITGANVGPDWRNALSAWVHAHAYYPEQAAQMGQSGNSTVHVEADHDGRVRSVELETKSGSQWLDLALLGLFRGAHLPPLPPDHPDAISFDFTMRYILIH